LSVRRPFEISEYFAGFPSREVVLGVHALPCQIPNEKFVDEFKRVAQGVTRA